ncbi:glycosylphosphatidylinositol anchor attachment 1 protein, putative [Hepatocystis sp. ex Piliocolobus tephrosceles]|nr:glycosylphosphatidylinositol anchor attachment 1 protein, putative [Hepatocystis sp. ex Piliocolobus tephrosceles]
MGLSENPKLLLIGKRLAKYSKLIGTTISILGFVYFCFFYKLNMKTEMDSRMFSLYPGNSLLNESDEEFMQKVNNYFLNYDYKEGEHIIDIIQSYIESISPIPQVEKHKIKVNELVDDYILVSNVPCKFCNILENLIVVLNFHYNERQYFHSINVGLTLINHFLNCNYMSKDITFLFTNKALPYSLGIQKFIELYFYNNNYNQNGIFRGAVVIEFDHMYASQIQINYEGLNGALPNQDMIILLKDELHEYGIPIKVQPVYNVIYDMAFEKSYEKGHIHFLRENISSFTVSGVTKVPLKSKSIKLFDFTKSIQSFIRSQSNTHEGYCNSTHFYFFNTIDRYIPLTIYCYSAYLLCVYVIIKIFRTSIFRNYLNFILGLFMYIITMIIISLPLYLFSTNDKIYELLNIDKKLPICTEWHPNNFNTYMNKANSWLSIFLISLLIGFFINYIMLYVISKFNKINNGGYRKVIKMERIAILEEIRLLNNKKKKLLSTTDENNNNDNNECGGNNDGNKKNHENTQLNISNLNRTKKLIKPKVINSDDENFIIEKNKDKLIKEVQDQIELMENKLLSMNNLNVKYIITKSLAPYSSIMKYMNIFYFIFVMALSAVYNWSYSIIFTIMFVVPISILHNRKQQKTKKNISKIIILFFILLTLLCLYPFEGFILDIRVTLINLLMRFFENCGKLISDWRLSKYKCLEFFEFLFSNRIFDNLYLNKYYLNNENTKINYNYKIKNEVLLNLYSLARNHYCIGSQFYPLLCFTIFPIIFYITFVFCC